MATDILKGKGGNMKEKQINFGWFWSSFNNLICQKQQP